MKILIAGAGASGLVLAIKLKQANPKIDVLVVEKNTKAGKKLLATGNGHANIGNRFINEITYENDDIFKNILYKCGYNAQQTFFNSIGMKTKQVGDLCYPFSDSAFNFTHFLFNLAVLLKVKFLFGENVIDYTYENDKIKVFTSVNTHIVDKLVFATGGKSYPNLGGSDSIFELLKKHNYLVTSLYPGLCPIKTKQKTKSISGVRVKGEVTLKQNNKVLYQENGEVLFKNDGISGIVIFNISSLIARRMDKNKDFKIEIDLFSSVSEEELLNEFKNRANIVPLLDGYFISSLRDYILSLVKLENKNIYSDIELRKIVMATKHLSFDFDDLYNFENAQVTVGGVAVNNINNDLSSKIEKNIYFAGEMLNNDGLCGGYNLMWAFACALYLGDILCK